MAKFTVTPTGEAGKLTPEQIEEMEARRTVTLPEGAQPELPTESLGLLEQARTIVTGGAVTGVGGQAPFVVPEQPALPGITPELGAMVDPMGQAVTGQQAQALAQEELGRQQQEVEERLGPMDLVAREDFEAAYSYLDDPTTVGAMQRAAMDTGEVLSQYNYAREGEANQSGIDVLNNLVESPSPIITNNAIIKSLVTIGTGAYQKSEVDPNVGSMLDEGSVNEFLLDFEDLASGKEQGVVGGGIEADTFHSMMGNQIFNNIHRPQVNEFGQPIACPVVQDPTNTNMAGQLATQALVDTGFLIKRKRPLVNDPNKTIPAEQNPEVEVYVVGPEGHKFIMNSKEIARNEDLSKINGRTQVVPVGESGFYSGALALTRRGDIPRTGQSKKPEALASYQRKAGQVGRSVNPNGFFMYALMNSLMNTGVLDESTNAQLNKILNTSVGEKPGEVIEVKADQRQKQLQLLGENLLEGKTRYAPHFLDPSVNRLYDDTIDMNAQRYTQVRGTIQASKRGLVTPSFREAAPGESLVNPNIAINFVNSLESNYNREFSPREKELSFLWTISKNLHSDSEGWTIERTLGELTPEKMQQFAQKGAVLKKVLPQDANEATVTMALSGNMPLPQLSEADMNTLREIIGSMGKKDWGFKMQAYIDAHNYMTKPQFMPSTLAEMDMNSAGRAFLAADIGNEDVLERVGLIYENLSFDSENPTTLPFGSPRKHFYDLTSVVLRQYYNTPETSEQGQALISALKAAEKEYGQEFIDDFGKKVLLTTDYGKAITAHTDAAQALFDKYPMVFEAVSRFSNNPVREMADVYSQVLFKAIDSFQMSTPKKMAMALALVNKVPNPTGYYNESIPFGMTKMKPTSTSMVALEGPQLQALAPEVDPGARGRVKTFDDTPYMPPVMSNVANAIGPALGQYRESIILETAVNEVNKNNEIPDFFMPVFDNLIVNGTDALKYHYAANNIATKNAFSWNMKEEYFKDFQQKFTEGVNEIPEVVSMDKNSPYYPMLQHLDENVRFLERVKNDDPTLAKGVKENVRGVEEFINVAKQNGYVPITERGADVPTLSGTQYKNILQAFMVINKLRGNKNNMVKWLRDHEGKREKALNKIFRQRYIYFMT
jgi:hypothetical protein